MYLASRWLFRNLSRLELVAAWIIILLLIGGLTRYGFGLLAHAERSMVDRTINNINTSLSYHFTMAVLRHDHEQLQRLIDMNPIDILNSAEGEYLEAAESMDSEELAAAYPFMSSPVNYGGLINGQQPQAMEKGTWYFNETDKLLVYVVRNPEVFHSEVDGPERLRYRMIIDYRDVNGNGAFEPGVDEYRSVGMRAVDEYRWVL